MNSLNSESMVCQICGAKANGTQLIPGAILRPNIVAEIRKAFGNWSSEKYICQDDLNRYRSQFVETILQAEKGELTTLEQDVLTALARHELVAEHIDAEYQQRLTFGEKLSDQIATFGGSWKFIIVFFTLLAVWIAFNSMAFLWGVFDPYPYILLNLILSCLASIQAPIIMMSQNRQEAKDRLRSEGDYRVNLKAELEIRHLHEKVDHLLNHQWERLVEIQKVQLEMMQELLGTRPNRTA
jgi:uncharacterized membrane protein